MNCAEAEYLEPLYRSGELDPKTMADIDLHLGLCRTCALRWKEQDWSDALLRDAVTAEEADATAVIARARQAMQLRARKSLTLKLAALATAASVVAAVLVLSIFLAQPRAEPALYVDAAEDHADEVVQHAPRNWVRGRTEIERILEQELATAGLAQTLAPAGYHVDRAKICRLLDRRYVHLVYSDGTREISFFVRQKAGEQVPGEVVQHVNGIPVQAGRAKGLEVAGFQSAHLTVLVVSGVPRDDTVRFAIHAAAGV